MVRQALPAASPHVAAFVAEPNRNILLLVQIETRVGIENRNDILSTPGIDGCVVGTGDLSFSLGYPGRMNHPEVRGAVEKVFATCREKNDHALLGGTVRALTVELRDELASRVEDVLHATCAVSRVEGRFEYEPNYPATINEAVSAETARAALQATLGHGCLWTASVPIMGAEDFSYYLQRTPGAFMLLGSGRSGRPVEPCHSPRFDYDDELIPVVVRLWARLARAPVP